MPGQTSEEMAAKQNVQRDNVESPQCNQTLDSILRLGDAWDLCGRNEEWEHPEIVAAERSGANGVTGFFL